MPTDGKPELKLCTTEFVLYFHIAPDVVRLIPLIAILNANSSSAASAARAPCRQCFTPVNGLDSGVLALMSGSLDTSFLALMML